MSAEQGPLGPDREAERFAVAEEQGRPPASAGDRSLARDLEIAAMLRARGAQFAPAADERARVRARILAALADDAGAPAEADRGHPLEHTAPMGRVLPFPLTDEPTTVLPIVDPATEVAAAEPPAAETVAATDAPIGSPEPVPAATRPGRRSRHSLPSRPAARPRTERKPGRVRRRALVAGAAALLVIAVAGGGIFASRDAVPGDFLYGVKRAAESAGIALAGDQETRGYRNLDMAATRIDELETMTERGGPGTLDPSLVSSTIEDFEASTGAGSRMLLDAPDAGGLAALRDIRSWAAAQVARLAALQAALPASARPGTEGSITLLDRLLARAEALAARASCTEVTSGAVDDLGPLPATGPCVPRPVVEGHPTGPAGAPAIGGARSADPSGRPSPSGTETPDATVAPTPTPGPLLPDVGTGTSGPAAPTTTAAAPPSNTRVPLPLLPPINLPPLLPGQPGVTLG